MSQQSYFYQELREMLQQPGCPICHVGRKVARSQIDALLYDSVTDRDSREKLAASMGFCSAHSRELLTFSGERLGATIIEWALLREAQRRLQRTAPAAGPSLRQRLRGQPAAGSGLTAAEPCPVCANQATQEARSLRELLSAIPFILIFVGILLLYITLIVLVASALNGVVAPRVHTIVTRMIIVGILLGILGMFQAVSMVFYTYGFVVLLFSTLAYILWSHVTPAFEVVQEEARGGLAAH